MESEEFESYVINESASDRRTCTRFSPIDPIRQTLLVYRRREYPAELMNLSANGCNVTTSLKVKVNIGDELVLLSRLGRFLTRVAHVETQETARQLGLRFIAEYVEGEGNKLRSLEVGKGAITVEMNGQPNHWLPLIAVAFVAGLACVVSNATVRGEILQRIQTTLGAAQAAIHG
jgi:hypothetical protein